MNKEHNNYIVYIFTEVFTIAGSILKFGSAKKLADWPAFDSLKNV